jgi:hypothetical protein
MRAHPKQNRLPHRSRQRGVLLGVVLVLMAVLFTAGAFALWSMRSDTGSAGRDRLSRQLFDCAEQGLSWGKQYFSVNIGQTSGGMTAYLNANICSTAISSSSAGHLPCWTDGGPFSTTGTGSAIPNYPGGAPFTQQIKMDSRQGAADFEFTVGIYNDPGDPSGPNSDSNNKVVVYSRCTDLSTFQQRSVQALISVTPATSTDYTGQAGRGFRNQGNQNF